MSRVAVRVRPLAGQSCSGDVSGASSPSASQDLDSRRRRAEARNFQQVSLLLRAILVLPRDRPTDLYPRPSSPPQALVMGWVDWEGRFRPPACRKLSLSLCNSLTG